mmetsp:Transcript_49160/g.104542  ORF Transcript_49160/g.104542 Transcript_49160/m.104542 type:complete len:397 (+) Transcript_49160:325-1515(+)
MIVYCTLFRTTTRCSCQYSLLLIYGSLLLYRGSRRFNLNLLLNVRLGRRSQNGLGHDRAVVVRDLPLSILEDVDEGVPSLNFVTSGSHREFIDASVLAPVVANGDRALQDLALRLLLQETDEVVLDKCVISSWNIRNCGKEHRLGRVTISNLVGILSGQGIVPELEQILHLLLGDRFRLEALRHDRAVMLGDLPLSILEDVHEGVASLDLLTSGAHGELIDSGILSPVGAHDDIPGLNLALGFELEEVGEVVDDPRVVGPGLIADGGEEDAGLGVTPGDLLGVLGGEGVVPEAEEATDLILGDGLGGDDALGEDGAVVVVDLPLAVLVDVDVRIPSPDLLASGAHGELVDASVLSPVGANNDVPTLDLALGLQFEEVGEVVDDPRVVGPGLVTDGG